MSHEQTAALLQFIQLMAEVSDIPLDLHIALQKHPLPAPFFLSIPSE